MDRNKQLMAITGILVLGLIVTSVGWFQSHREVIKLKNVDSQVAQYEDSLAVCESNTATTYDPVTCVDRLTQLSKLLSKYEEKIKNIKIEN